MLNSLQDTDFLVRGIPTIEKIDLENRSLIEALACVNIYYLIYAYSTTTNYKKSLRLLQKFVSKSYKNKIAIEQIFLTCIKFNDQKLLEINMNVYNKIKGKEIEKLRFFYELQKKVINIEIPTVLHFNARASAIFLRIKKQDFTYKYTDFFRKSCDTPGNYSVYDINCNTDYYKDILTRMDDYLLLYPDHNIIFLYTYISNMGCITNNCTKKCSKTFDNKLKETLLNPLYLNKIGEDDRKFIIRFYNCRKTVKYKIKYLKNEEIEPRKLTYKFVINKNEVTENTCYISNKIKNANDVNKKIYKDEVKNLFGAKYSKKILENYFKGMNIFKKTNNNL